MKVKLKVKLVDSPYATKRYRMLFYHNGHNIHHTDFGSKYENYTIHHDDNRRRLFLARFNKLIKEHEKDYTAPIILSKYILWNKKTIEESFKNYKQTFGLD